MLLKLELDCSIGIYPIQWPSTPRVTSVLQIGFRPGGTREKKRERRKGNLSKIPNSDRSQSVCYYLLFRCSNSCSIHSVRDLYLCSVVAAFQQLFNGCISESKPLRETQKGSCTNNSPQCFSWPPGHKNIHRLPSVITILDHPYPQSPNSLR